MINAVILALGGYIALVSTFFGLSMFITKHFDDTDNSSQPSLSTQPNVREHAHLI